jgi:hypothetical protein
VQFLSLAWLGAFRVLLEAFAVSPEVAARGVRHPVAPLVASLPRQFIAWEPIPEPTNWLVDSHLGGDIHERMTLRLAMTRQLRDRPFLR